MAVINYTILTRVKGIHIIAWLNLANGDTGSPFEGFAWPDKSVQVVGTFGTGGNCQIQGANMASSLVYAALNDPQGNVLDITTAKIETLLENTYWTRPSITAGDVATDLSVYLVACARHFVT